MRITKVQFMHPKSGYVQSYRDWVDDGYGYDLLAEGLIPVVPAAVKDDKDVVEWCESALNKGYSVQLFDDYSTFDYYKTVDTTTGCGVEYIKPQDSKQKFESLFTNVH